MYKVKKRDGTIVSCDISRIRRMINFAKADMVINTNIEAYIPLIETNVITTHDIIKTVMFGIKSQIPLVDFAEAKKLDAILANIEIMDFDKEVAYNSYKFDNSLKPSFGYDDSYNRLMKLKKYLSADARDLLTKLDAITETNKGAKEVKTLLQTFVEIILVGKDPTNITSPLLTRYKDRHIERPDVVISPLHHSIVASHRSLFAVKAKYKDGEIIPILKFHEYYFLQALLLADDFTNLQEVEENFFDLLNTISLPSPSRMNLLSDKGSLTSCEILTPADNLNSINSSISALNRGSKSGTGYGMYVGNWRGVNDEIQGVPFVAGGSYPYCLLAQSATISTQQLNLRKAGLAVYTDIFHSDLEQFMEGKAQSGDITKKIWDIHRGFAIPDLFFKKEEADEDWMLISPHESKKFLGGKALNEFFGEEFEEAYENLASLSDHLFTTRSFVNAKSLFKEVVRMAIEEGDPFILFRDTANRYHMNSHKGDIYSSNLCSEILGAQKPNSERFDSLQSLSVPEQLEILNNLTDDDIGYNPTCNLCSISLTDFFYADPVGKNRIMQQAIKMMDKIVSTTTSADLSADKYNTDFNPIGIGAMNLTSLLIEQNIPYRECEETKRFITDLMFDFAYYAYKASMERATTHGAYPAFEGSAYSKGELLPQVDLDYLRPEQIQALNSLKEDIKRNGLRNGYLMAIAPNSGTALATHQTASVYPVNNIVNLVDSLGEDTYIIPSIFDDGRPSIWYNQYLAENVPLEDLAFVYSLVGNFLDQGLSASFSYNLVKHSPFELYKFYKRMFANGAKTVYYSKTQTNVCTNCAN